eukprot:7602234-Pyramimonas_sp.AAC.1
MTRTPVPFMSFTPSASCIFRRASSPHNYTIGDFTLYGERESCSPLAHKSQCPRKVPITLNLWRVAANKI